MSAMSLREFIRKYRNSIDAQIRKSGVRYRLSDQERELWVRNDESLCRMAKTEGVKV